MAPNPEYNPPASSGSGGSTTAVVTVTELPAAGSATVVYRLRTAGGELTGYYAWDEHAGAYTMLPTLDQVQDVVEAAGAAVEITLLAANWSSGTYTVACTVANTAAVRAGMRCPEPSAAIADAIAAAGLRLSAVTTGSITFTADRATPTSDIIISVEGVTL